jgi:hypothetical protein
MSTVYCVGVHNKEFDDVLFISLSKHDAVEYYKKIEHIHEYRSIDAKYVVKTQLNKEIKEGMCNEETVVSRDFSVPYSELLEQREMLHKNIAHFKRTLSSIDMQRKSFSDEINRLIEDLEKLNVNLFNVDKKEFDQLLEEVD